MADKIIVNLSSEEEMKVTVPDINYIPAYKVAEEQRRTNELERISNENERIEYYEEIQNKVANGEFNGEPGPQGPSGKDGTVSFEELTDEQRESLRGPQGIQGIQGEKGETGPQGPQGEKGDKYTLTEKDCEEISTVVENDIQPILDNIEKVANQAEIIARGRATGYVFDTLADLEIWLQNSGNTSKLTLGDNFYIRATDVPDYWWDGSTKQKLEAEKPDFNDYVKNTDYATTTVGGVVKLNPAYGINRNTANNNLYINAATNAEIDARTSVYKPVVPSNLDYAVGSVKASETQSGTIKVWLSTENGETGLNISTEV